MGLVYSAPPYPNFAVNLPLVHLYVVKANISKLDYTTHELLAAVACQEFPFPS
jgi:hypothetical protein